MTQDEIQKIEDMIAKRCDKLLEYVNDLIQRVDVMDDNLILVRERVQELDNGCK
jgi:hypothetical protein